MVTADIFVAMIDLSKNWNAHDVRHLCEEHELSQHKLAALLNLRVMTINNWITGKVQPSRIASIALTYVAHDLANELLLKKSK